MVPFEARLSGHVGRFVRVQLEEFDDRSVDPGGDEFRDFVGGGMPPSIGSSPALRNRDDCEWCEVGEGSRQIRGHPEKVSPQDVAPLFLPSAEKGSGGACGDQDRVTALEPAPPQIESMMVQADGCKAGCT